MNVIQISSFHSVLMKNSISIRIEMSIILYPRDLFFPLVRVVTREWRFSTD